MSFGDTQRADDVTLRDRITLKDDNGEWVTGKVIELALYGSKYETIRITILTDDKTARIFHRMPDAPVIYEITGAPEDPEEAARERARDQGRQALLKNSAHVPDDPTHDPR